MGVQTYTALVKAILYNRILLFLGFFGLFVAGVLSLAHFMGVVPPCGAASDCDKVTNDPSSMWFAWHAFPGIYVGYIGLAGYVVLTALGLARMKADSLRFRQLAGLGYLVAVGGTLVSIGLQFYSYFVIHAMCKWCLTSAVTMTVTLVVYALMYQEVMDHPGEPRATEQSSGPNFLLSGVFTLALALAMAGMYYELGHSDRLHGKLVQAPKNFPLVPPNPNLYGDPNAPITIVEFADLNCPACQRNSPKLKDYVRQHEGKVRLVYRQCPLQMHRTSAVASAIDEYAATKGKFWDYTMAVMGTNREIENPEELFQIAQSINLDVDDIKKHLSDPNDPVYKRISDDKNCASLIGIQATPTFIVMAPNSQPSAYGPVELFTALNRPPYSTIIEGK